MGELSLVVYRARIVTRALRVRARVELGVREAQSEAALVQGVCGFVITIKQTNKRMCASLVIVIAPK
jgi:hypothetical protein